MRYRAWDANGDYTFGNGGANFLVNTPQCVAQAILSRFALQLGEWFVDTSDGTPWATEVQGYGTAGTRDLVVQERAAGTMNVTEITNYQSSLNHNNRLFSAALIADTAFGSTGIVTVTPPPPGKPAPYPVPPTPFANAILPAPTPTPAGG